MLNYKKILIKRILPIIFIGTVGNVLKGVGADNYYFKIYCPVQMKVVEEEGKSQDVD